MIIKSEGLSQDEFVRKILERDVRNIYKAQQKIIGERIWHEGRNLKAVDRKIDIRRRTGRLENALSNPDFYLKSSGETFEVAANYPIYIRFLDMRRKKDLRIYNRQIWGILYNNSMKEIKFEYGKEIADKVGDALRAAFPGSDSSGKDNQGFDGAAYSKAKGK